MGTLFIVLAVISAVLLVLIVLAQNPKGGIKNQLGASSSVFGVKKTTDVLEKATWVLAGVVIICSVAATKFSGSKSGKEELDENFKAAQKLNLQNPTTQESAPTDSAGAASSATDSGKTE
jgi:preprotein translocase subunit SecG